MNTHGIRPFMGLLLTLLAIVAVVIVFSANANHKGLEEVALVTEPTTSPAISITPKVSLTIYPIKVITTPVPPPIPTLGIPTAVPSISGTSTTAPATITAIIRARQTALAEEVGPLVPDPDADEHLAESTAYQSLFTSPGTVIAEGANTVPTGTLSLLTYRVEEVLLPGPTTFTRLTVGHTITVDRAWRVTITGGPFLVDNATSYYLLVNGGAVAAGLNRTLTLTFLVFDRSILQDGATLGVFASPPRTLPLPGDNTLPEQLHFQS